MMKTTRGTNHLLFCIAMLLLATAGTASAQDIYKCITNKQVTYTDHPCPGSKGELLHQANDSEIIEHYLNLGQDDLARRYADAHHLDSLYKQRLEARKQEMDAKIQQQADEAATEKLHEEAEQQQALIDVATSRNRLQGENDALRQQNAAYSNQLSQPVNNFVEPYYNTGPGYWGGYPPYGGYKPDPVRPVRPVTPPPPTAVFHPCVPIAGDKAKC